LKLGEDFSGETGSAAESSSAYKFGVGIRLGKIPLADEQVPAIGSHAVDGGSDLRMQFRHEFAHEIFNTQLNKSQKSSWEAVAKPLLGTSTVSRYGGTNSSELFSEAFAAYTSPKYKPGSLPSSVEGWMRKNLGINPASMSDDVEEFQEVESEGNGVRPATFH